MICLASVTECDHATTVKENKTKQKQSELKIQTICNTSNLVFTITN